MKVTSTLTMSPSRKRLVVRNAVADDMIDRGADGFAIAAIIERGRIGAVGYGEVEDEIVQRLGGDAGLHMRDEHVERLGRQPAGEAHALEILGVRGA